MAWGSLLQHYGVHVLGQAVHATAHLLALIVTEVELASQVCSGMQAGTHAHNAHACSSTGPAAHLHALITSLQPDLMQVCPPQVCASLLALVQLLLGC